MGSPGLFVFCSIAVPGISLTTVGSSLVPSALAFAGLREWRIERKLGPIYEMTARSGVSKFQTTFELLRGQSDTWPSEESARSAAALGTRNGGE